jgi:two-component system response regulator HydG
VTEGVARALAPYPRLTLETVDSLAVAENRLWSTSPGLVLIHLGAENEDGRVERLLKALAVQSRPPALVVLGGAGQIQRGLELLKRGAADYLEWPRDARRLALLADLISIRSGRDLTTEPHPARPPDAHELICTPGSALGRVLEQLKCVAPVQTTVLFQGETGTGKTTLARILHDQSAQCDGPFVEVNCAALPESLFESELFGHTKGAFTSAAGERMGRLRAAANGTLFLDEIDTLSVVSQAKLLRVLQSGEFEPVGSDAPQKLDNVRVVAASNRSLEAEVAAGRFRADLFFRLGVVTFSVPPLREQDPACFAALVHRFVREFAAKARRVITGISPDALAVLQRESWPGNVRQLRNVIERAVALRPGGLIGLEDLPEDMRAKADIPPAAPQVVAESTLADVRGVAEKAQIVAILRKTRNNRSRAAAELGISRNTLYNKLRQYGLLHAVV